jgi:hypothetical protein
MKRDYLPNGIYWLIFVMETYFVCCGAGYEFLSPRYNHIPFAFPLGESIDTATPRPTSTYGTLAKDVIKTVRTQEILELLSITVTSHERHAWYCTSWNYFT